MFLGGAVAVALIAVVALILINRGSDNGESEPPLDVVVAEAFDASIPVTGQTMGNPEASVTVVEWGDFQ
jgi:hypothetical protein